MLQQTRQLASLTGYLFNGIKSEICGPANPDISSLYNMHAGETCFILGNGPSLNKIPNNILQKHITFGTNGIFLKYLPNYYVTISNEFYKNHSEEIINLKNTTKFIGSDLKDIISGEDNEFLLSCYWNRPGRVFGINFPMPLRFSRKADRVVFLGGSVLFVCLQLAYWMGFEKVILLGVDHNFGFSRSKAVYGGQRLLVGQEDNIHFSKAYLKPGTEPHCDMIATERAFELALNAFQADNREIWNATDNTALEVIPCRPLIKLLHSDIIETD